MTNSQQCIDLQAFLQKIVRDFLHRASKVWVMRVKRDAGQVGRQDFTIWNLTSTIQLYMNRQQLRWARLPPRGESRLAKTTLRTASSISSRRAAGLQTRQRSSSNYVIIYSDLTLFIVETGLYPSTYRNNSFFAGSEFEDLDPKLGELIYSEQPPTTKEIEKKARWIHDAYGPVAEKS